MPRTVHIFIVISLAGFLVCPPPAWAQSGGVAAGGPTFRPVRSASGTKGSVQNGRYILEDPRTIFYVPEDKQVIVYFEWEGPTGSHKFEGLWKNPDGKITVISEFSFESDQKRYGGYWALLTNETMPTGVWSLEARVDGESAGTYQFQILASGRPADVVPTKPVRIPMTTAKIYQHLLGSRVIIHRLNGSGQRFGSGLGFVLGPGYVATAFQTVDGASNLTLEFSDGRNSTVAEVANFNRRQDWAILKTETGGTPALSRAETGSWAVGDRCFSLDVATEGNLTIAELDITGKNTFAGAGERINVSYFFNRKARGAPIINEYGELVGHVGGDLIPGSSVIEGMRWGTGLIEGLQAMQGGLAVPTHLVTLASPRAMPLSEMLKTGHFTPPLLGHEHVMNGSTTKNVNRQFGMPSAVDYTTEFSRTDKQINVIINFQPKDKLKGLLTFRLFDVDNRSLWISKARKLDLKPNVLSFVDFAIPPQSLQPGVYRIDAFIDENPVWRGYFRVLP